MKITKALHFNLGLQQNKAKLYFRKTFSNIFLTLTDLCSKTIVCKTSGCSGVRNSKRAKKSPYAVENIVKELNIYFKLYILLIYLLFYVCVLVRFFVFY